MQFKSSILASFAAFGAALAANSTNPTTTNASPSVTGTAVCTYTKTYSVTDDAAAQTLAALPCQTFDGDIEISGAVSAVSLTNIQQIRGSLTVDGATALTAFIANSLIAVQGKLVFTNLTILEDLELANLYKVGALTLQALPAVTDIQFTTGLTEVDSVLISDTGLTNITGLVFSSIDSIDINNNGDLKEVEIPTLETVQSALGVTYNAEDVDVTLDGLIWANNITFRDVGSFSMENLTVVNASIAFISNGLESIELNSLTKVGGSFSISNNTDLNEVDVSNLTSIGGAFIISGNDDLKTIDGFEDLKTVGGAIKFSGDFTNATLSSLKEVKGGATIKSTGDLDCSAFNKLSKKGAIKGKGYKCSSPHTSTSAKASKTDSSDSDSNSDSDSSSTDSSSGSSSSSSKASADVITSSFGALLAAFALSLF